MQSREGFVMKKKFILMVISMCVLSQSRLYCADNPKEQTWSQWWKSIWKMVPAKAPAAGAAVGYGVAKALPDEAKMFGAVALTGLGIQNWDWNSYEKLALGMGTVGLMGYFALLAYTISLWNDANQTSITRVGCNDEETIKERLRYLVFGFILNETLYPTYTSRVNALAKKDDFFHLSFYKNYLLVFNNACDYVMKRFVSSREELKDQIKVGQWDKMYYFGKTKEEWEKVLARETEIDNYITLFKQLVANLSLEDQLKTLEKTNLAISEKDTYLDYSSRMIAFLSVYGRLKNKLEILRSLSPQELAVMDPWKLGTGKKGEKTLLPAEEFKPIHAKHSEFMQSEYMQSLEAINKELVEVNKALREKEKSMDEGSAEEVEKLKNNITELIQQRDALIEKKRQERKKEAVKKGKVPRMTKEQYEQYAKEAKARINK